MTNPAHIRVLLVEDETPLADSICEFLSMQGYEVKAAENGLVALNILEKFTPDIVICDIAMPKMNGLELLQAVRNNQRLFKIPFIFLTARTEKQDLREAMQLGADDFISKPFKFVEIEKAIEARLLRQKQLTKVYINDEDAKIIAQMHLLSSKEVTLLHLISLGKTTKEISEELFISPKTVENHRYNISQKLGLKGQGNLLKFALKVKEQL